MDENKKVTPEDKENMDKQPTAKQSADKHPAKISAARSKRGMYTAAISALVVAIVIVFNLLVGSLPAGTLEYDISNQSVYTVTEQSRDYLKTLDKDISIIVLAQSEVVDKRILKFINNYARLSSHLKLQIDHGMLRKNEFEKVMEHYQGLGLNVIGVDASEKFFEDLEGVTEPEQKRKIIGRDFVEVFDAEAKKITDARWLAQGTIYPDRIESLSITGMTIKSHHNVGGLPEEMNLKLCEPLKWLFKDEVRRVGRQMQMPERLINRHPFPGPGLAVRILGDITREKVRILQDADDIYIETMHEWKDTDGVFLYDKVWQAGAVLLSTVRSVGVMGDERTYENPVALRAVTSMDAMTADWAHLPYEFLAKVSNDIINKVKGVNRVCYDISSKPPSTIEWE